MCRQSSSRVLQAAENKEEGGAMDDFDMFAAANVGGDGKMTLEEFMGYMNATEEQGPEVWAKFVM